MNDARSWILALALVSFFAGLAAGVMLSTQDAARRGPLADYERQLLETFDLGPERARALRTILRAYEHEIARIEGEHLAAYRTAIEPDLDRLGIAYDTHIRDQVLPPSQRALFDDLSRGLPFTQSGTP